MNEKEDKKQLEKETEDNISNLCAKYRSEEISKNLKEVLNS